MDAKDSWDAVKVFPKRPFFKNSFSLKNDPGTFTFHIIIESKKIFLLKRRRLCTSFIHLQISLSILNLLSIHPKKVFVFNFLSKLGNPTNI